MATESDINGQTYRIGKLDCFAQLNVARKIAPLLPRLVPAFKAMAASTDDQVLALAGAAGPFADALADMTDESAAYVMRACLSVVHRKQGERWAPVWAGNPGAVMFDDMDLSATLPIIVQVIQDSLGPFLAGLLTGQTPAQA